MVRSRKPPLSAPYDNSNTILLSRHLYDPTWMRGIRQHPPTPNRKHRRPPIDERAIASGRATSKYTAPPNPQGDRPRSMRSLAINYRIPKSLAAWTTPYGFPVSSQGVVTLGEGLVTGAQAQKIPRYTRPARLMVWCGGSLWMNPPYAFDRPQGGEAWRIWQWSNKRQHTGDGQDMGNK